MSYGHTTWMNLKARFKSLHTAGFQLWDILEKAKLYGQRRDQWLPRAGIGGRD